MTPAPLISVSVLATALADWDPRYRPAILDVRWDLQQGPRPDRFADAHIPTAVFVDLDTALAADSADGRRGRHPLPDAETFCAAMRAGGVDNDRPVVVYDDAGGTIAARAWWLLRHYGHPDVTILDGGLQAWQAAGHPIQTGDLAESGGESPTAPRTPTDRDRATATTTHVPAGDFTGEPGHMPTLDVASAAALAAAPDGLLLDARPGERFRGETEPIDSAAGHVPGARSRPTRDNLDADGLFRARAVLAAAFAAVGAHPTSPTRVGVYCGSGVTAAHEVLALEIAGIPAALYPGSWSEWSADPTRPVQTGDVA